MKRPLVILMNPDGTPAPVEMAVRPSEVGHGRAKATFVAKLEPGAYMFTPEGNFRVVDEDGDDSFACLTREFRLELTN